jgi:trimeric autotransporter adhesin
MKKYFIASAMLLFGQFNLHAQSVGIGTNTPNPSAKLDIADTARGMLMPRLTKAQRNAIASPALGLMIFNISDSSVYYFNGAWQRLPHENEVWRLKGNELNNTEFLGSTILRNINIRSGNDAAGAILPSRLVTSWGYKALNASTPGLFNTAFGASALEVDSIGTTNVGLGAFTLSKNTTGSGNMAIGFSALQSNISGNTNIAIGTQAGANIISGNNNVFIGSFVNANDEAPANAVVIGTSAIGNASNKVRLGNSGITVVEGQVPYSTPSDGRFKTNVKENVSGLDFIMKLRPVTYQFNTKQYDDFLHKNIKKSPTDETTFDYTESQHLQHSGFIAQEVEQAVSITGYNFDGLHVPKNGNETYSLAYSQFVMPLVKGMQEQQQTIEQLQKQVAALQTIVTALTTKK